MGRLLPIFVLTVTFPALILGYQDPSLDTGGSPSEYGDELALLDQVKQVLEQASTPLTEEQEAALRPLVQNQVSESGPSSADTDEGLSERAKEILTPEQSDALKRADAGRTLLTQGVEGLRTVLEAEGVPPLTFDQETQVQNVYEQYSIEYQRLLEEDRVQPGSVSTAVLALEEQLLLAALKFLNPAQRTALTGTLTTTNASALLRGSGVRRQVGEFVGHLRPPLRRALRRQQGA